MADETDLPPILIKLEEVLTLQQAAHRANKSVDTVKRLCRKHHIARQAGPHGRMEISAVALEMVIHGDLKALAQLRSGNRDDQMVRRYFDHLGLPI
ncbi:hypothetical protein [Pararhizobium sp.]|uniref:hypothetical protein n=1 Tax=Pararhizobium sp. TaxID=1977563 RepID=UPI00271D40B6|nr:hypothetical protein [Pararhizobium sp.]MDO9416207.1 hypothetical protein [Pararhizobium sp.]